MENDKRINKKIVMVVILKINDKNNKNGNIRNSICSNYTESKGFINEFS